MDVILVKIKQLGDLFNVPTKVRSKQKYLLQVQASTVNFMECFEEADIQMHAVSSPVKQRRNSEFHDPETMENDILNSSKSFHELADELESNYTAQSTTISLTASEVKTLNCYISFLKCM